MGIKLLGTKIFHKTARAVVFFLSTVMAILSHGQGTLVQISGPPDTTGQYGGLFVPGNLINGISWQESGSFSNVNISIALEGDSGATGTAYLTTKIGPGTTAANAISSMSFAFPASSGLTTVLTGINLGPGTFYLIVKQTAAGTTGNGMWDGTPSPNITSAANATANGEYVSFGTIQSYAPATSFSEGFVTHFDYSITAIPVPEASSFWLLLLGGALAFLKPKRN